MSAAIVASPEAETPEGRVRIVLAQRARALARPARLEQTGSVVALVLFSIGGRQHAVEAGYVREVLRRPMLSMVPSAPAALVGVAHVRGEILAVADISSLLGVAASPVPGPVVVIEGPGPPLGLLVEEVHDFVDVPADSIAPVPGNGRPAGPSSESVLLGVIPRATVLSAPALLNDPRLSTTKPRSGR